MTAAAWNATWCTVIHSWFRHARFSGKEITSMTAAADDDAPLSLTPGTHAAWKLLQEAGNVPGNIELNEIDTDGDTVAHEEVTDEDMIRSVCKPDVRW